MTCRKALTYNATKQHGHVTPADHNKVLLASNSALKNAYKYYYLALKNAHKYYYSALKSAYKYYHSALKYAYKYWTVYQSYTLE